LGKIIKNLVSFELHVFTRHFRFGDTATIFHALDLHLYAKSRVQFFFHNYPPSFVTLIRTYTNKPYLEAIYRVQRRI